MSGMWKGLYSWLITYAASEDSIEGVSGEAFAKDSGAEYIGGNMQEVAEKLLPTLKNGNIVIGLGAGTITALGKELEGAKSKSQLLLG